MEKDVSVFFAAYNDLNLVIDENKKNLEKYEVLEVNEVHNYYKDFITCCTDFEDKIIDLTYKLDLLRSKTLSGYFDTEGNSIKEYSEQLNNAKEYSRFFAQAGSLKYFDLESKIIESRNVTMQDRLERMQTNLVAMENKTLTHTLTFMGVFTAIITIIISSIMSTTSWLNKSNTIDFTFAVLVPITIIVFSMISMFLLMYIVVFNKNKEQNNKLCLVLSIVGIVLICCALVGTLIYLIISKN